MALSLTVFGDSADEIYGSVHRLLASEEFEGVALWTLDQPIDGSIVIVARGVNARQVAEELPTLAHDPQGRPVLFVLAADLERMDSDIWNSDWREANSATLAVAKNGQAAVSMVRHWFNETFAQGEAERLTTGDGRRRAAVEALYDWVRKAIVDNDALSVLLADLEALVSQQAIDLSEQQIEIRELRARLDQVEKLNEALLRELSTARVNPETSSAIVRAMKFVGVLALNGLVSFTSAAGGVVATEAHFDAKATSSTLEQRCDEVVGIVEEVGPSDSGSFETEGRDDPTGKWPDDHTDTTWPVEEAQSFTMGTSTLGGPDVLG
jgi:hypothetical protein